MLASIRNLADDNYDNIEDEKPIINQAKIDMDIKQIELTHRNDDGFITIAVKNEDEFIQYHYKINSLVENIGKALNIDDANVYITPNSFFKPFRKIENIRKLNALYLDIDFYNLEKFENHTFEAIKYELEHDYFKSVIPLPNFIVNTGRGAAIYWLIEPLPYRALPLWNAVQAYFLEKLKGIGADSKSIDSARLMRLAGSTNLKNDKAAEIIIYDDNYINSLREIQEEYLPTLTPYVKNPIHKAKGKKSKVIRLYIIYNLHFSRLLDLVKLQELRQGYCRNSSGMLIEDTQREVMCFLHRYWSNCFTFDDDKAIKDTLDFNNNFVKPLNEREVIHVTASANKLYNEWMLNDFNIKKTKDTALNVKLQQ